MALTRREYLVALGTFLVLVCLFWPNQINMKEVLAELRSEGKASFPQQLAARVSDGELAALVALMKAVHFNAEKSGTEVWLQSPSWPGMGNIGNQNPEQIRDWVYVLRQFLLDPVARGNRFGTPPLLCEVGFNAGNSASLFLTAAGPGAKLIVFDPMVFTYSQAAWDMLVRMFPDNEVKLIKGYSPRSVSDMGCDFKCDFWSLDGLHNEKGVTQDIQVAQQHVLPNNLVLGDDWFTRAVATVVNRSVEAGDVVDLHVRGNRWSGKLVSRPCRST